MKAEVIIEGLNKHIESKRKIVNNTTNGHLVIQRIITTNPTFKAYKSYEVIVWFVKAGKKYKVLAVTHTAKVLEGQEEKLERFINTELCYSIFNWIGSKEYNQVIEGTFKGDV